MGPAVLEIVDGEQATVMSQPAAAHERWHRPVMVDEVVRLLQPRSGAVIVDGTLGTGGHSAALLPRLAPDGRLIAIDRDAEALAQARARLRECAPMVECVHGNYRDLPQILARSGVPAVDGLLLDVGMSSVQVDAPQRGFSFLAEGPLDMRMDGEQPVTAQHVLETATQDALAMMLQQYGEERYADRIARRIVQERQQAPIVTTTQLARLVVSALPAHARHGRLHAATRTFQALRMAVNQELEALEQALGSLASVLKPGGRAVIITFHSLEDRLVKHAFRDGAAAGAWSLLTKAPIRPTVREMSENVRARSAKLRAVERLAR